MWETSRDALRTLRASEIGDAIEEEGEGEGEGELVLGGLYRGIERLLSWFVPITLVAVF
jgi:hypothetical protein